MRRDSYHSVLRAHRPNKGAGAVVRGVVLISARIEARLLGINPIRGGAMDSIAGGSRCDFDFTVADDNYLFKNLGFRCCY